MSAVCRVLDEVGERLNALAQELTRQMQYAGDACDTAPLLALLEALTAPLSYTSDGSVPA